MEKQELIDIVESFRYRVKMAACYRHLYREYFDNFTTFSDGINKTPAFWFFTTRAYVHAMMIDLSKLYDNASNVYGVKHLLELCEKNQSLFEEKKLPDGERYFTDEEMAEFFAAFDGEETAPCTDNRHFLDILTEKYNQKSQQINSLRLQRNKLWAHNDCQNFLDPSAYEEEKLLTWADIDDLINLLVDISNTLLNHLGKEVSGIYPANIDDIQIVMDTMQNEENNHGQTENAFRQ